MRVLLTIALMLPLCAAAQTEKTGTFGYHSTDLSDYLKVEPGTRINYMDNGTSISMRLGELSLTIFGTGSGRAIVGAVCGEGGYNDPQSLTAMVSYPISLFSGTTALFVCPKGKFIGYSVATR